MANSARSRRTVRPSSDAARVNERGVIAMNRNPYQSYQTTGVRTATPGQLVVMLYDGAIKFMKQGENHLREPDRFVEATTSLLRAMEVVSELIGCLNPDASPELAENLSAVYNRVIDLISNALRERDPAPLAEALEIFSNLNMAWRQIATAAG